MRVVNTRAAGRWAARPGSRLRPRWAWQIRRAARVSRSGSRSWRCFSRPRGGGTPVGRVEVAVPIAAALVALAAIAERIVVQLGPRSWYTASTPAVVLAALLGGPFLGVAAGLLTQSLRTEAVWRRRSAEGGLAAVQGLAAGIVGTAGVDDGRRLRRR